MMTLAHNIICICLLFALLAPTESRAAAGNPTHLPSHTDSLPQGAPEREEPDGEHAIELLFQSKYGQRLVDSLIERRALSKAGLGKIQRLDSLFDGGLQLRVLTEGERMPLPEDIEVILQQGEKPMPGGAMEFIRFTDSEEDSARAFLGVWPSSADSELRGVPLGGIVENSAAEKAGLEKGDVITKINGQSVQSFSALATAIKALEPGSRITLDFSRKAEPQQTTAVLGKKPSGGKNCGQWLRIELGDSARLQAPPDDFPCKRVEKASIGVLIQDAGNPKGGAEILKVMREDEVLLPGDIILRCGRERIPDAKALVDALEERQAGQQLRLQLLREGKTIKRKVKLQSKWVWKCGEATENLRALGDSAKVKSDLGFQPLELQELRLFPNPSEGAFSLSFKAPMEKPISIVVSHSNGREILRDEIPAKQGDYLGHFNLGDHPPGVYFVNIRQGDRLSVEKVILR